MIALLLLLACGPGNTPDAVTVNPEPIGLAECSVCRMVVGEQPSPRAQLAYRDGTKVHTCSIDEARALATSPGPRGKPVSVWVEALPSDFDWTAHDASQLPWIAAGDAHYVFGAPRTRVMGVPVLSYADEAAAKRVAAKLGSRPTTWQDLIDTPVPQIPAAAGWTPHTDRSKP